MADFKRKTLLLASGKQVKLYGNSLAIGKNLQVGEGYAPNIFSCLEEERAGKVAATVSNPHKLTAEDLHDLADYNIQLWMNLKANVRRYGATDPRVFSTDPVGKGPEKTPKTDSDENSLSADSKKSKD